MGGGCEGSDVGSSDNDDDNDEDEKTRGGKWREGEARFEGAGEEQKEDTEKRRQESLV